MDSVTSYRARRASDSSDRNTSDSEAECDVWKRNTKRSSSCMDDSVPSLPPSSFTPSNTLDNTLSISTTNSRKRKVNNIWSDVIIEDEAIETLGHIGLEQRPDNAQDRSCESYDFTRKLLDNRPTPDKVQRMDSEDSYKNAKRPHSYKSHYIYGNMSKEDIIVAKKISYTLQEPKKHLICRVVRILGAQKATQLLKMTETIEDQGGMLVKNNSRRRSPGGVYLQLVKAEKSLTQGQLDEIFFEDSKPLALLKARRKAKSQEKKEGDSHVSTKSRKARRKRKHVTKMEIAEPDPAPMGGSTPVYSGNESETSPDLADNKSDVSAPDYITPATSPVAFLENGESDEGLDMEDGEIAD